MRIIDVISRLSKNDQIQLYKDCFDVFVDSQDTYKPIYNINGYQIERRYFLLYVQTYNDMYASYDERRLYNTITATKKDNKFEKLRNRYHEAFIMYIKNQDTEEYYEYLAKEARISIQTAKRYPSHYYDKYASDEERELFDQVKNDKVENAVEQREINNREKLKYIFDTCVNSKFNEDKIEELTEKYTISPKTVKNYLSQYYDMYASQEEKEKYNNVRIVIKKERENNARYVKIFNYILNEPSISKSVIFLLEQKDITDTYLKTSINPYKLSYPGVDTTKIEKVIEQYTKYIQYREAKKVRDKQLQKIADTKEKILEKQKVAIEQKISKQKELIIGLVNLVKAYNKSQYKNYEQFCAKYKIKLPQFECAIRVTAKADKEVYEQYQNKTKIQNRKKYVNETKEILQVIDAIKQNEKFSLLDYYYITKRSLENLKEISKQICTIDEYNIIEQFYEKNKNEKTINPAVIIKAEYVINSYGEQIELDDNTRLQIVNSLKEDNIPITPKIYLEAVRREIEQTYDRHKSKVA